MRWCMMAKMPSSWWNYRSWPWYNAGPPNGNHQWIPCQCCQIKGEEPQLSPFHGDAYISDGRFRNIFRVKCQEYEERKRIIGYGAGKLLDRDTIQTFDDMEGYEFMTGSHFEILGGRGKSKKYMWSILVNNLCLRDYLKRHNYSGASSAKLQVSIQQTVETIYAVQSIIVLCL